MTEDDQFRAELDQLGEEEVRKKLVHGAYNEKKRRIAEDWLAQKDQERQDKALERQELREHEALALARQANEYAAEANEHADNANRIAWFAFGIAAAALIASVVGWSK